MLYHRHSEVVIMTVDEIDVAITDTAVGVPNTSAHPFAIIVRLPQVLLELTRKTQSPRAQQPWRRPTSSVSVAQIVSYHIVDAYHAFHFATAAKVRPKCMWIFDVAHRPANISATFVIRYLSDPLDVTSLRISTAHTSVVDFR